MAEFIEVMRQAKRMCEEQQNIDCCVRCPINKNGCMVAADAEYVDYADAEQKIMHWAAEHPEPVYPTWREWQKNVFPDAGDDVYPCNYLSYTECRCKGSSCDECRGRRIPADIAEKLGIKPKEHDDETQSV